MDIFAALIVIYGGDVKITVFTNPNIMSANPYIILPEWLSVMGTVLWIVFITNAVNFIDGVDGLAGSVITISSVTLGLISIATGDLVSSLIAFILAGSMLGFLTYNFHPAKIFMQYHTAAAAQFNDALLGKIFLFQHCIEIIDH